MYEKRFPFLITKIEHIFYKLSCTSIPSAYNQCQYSPPLRVRVIFLQGGDGAKDGQKQADGQQWKSWSQKKAEEAVGAEAWKS